MADDRRQFDLQRLRDLGLDLDSSQDEAEVRSNCRLTQDCIDAGDTSLTLNPQTERFHCSNCGQSGTLRDLVRGLEAGPAAPQPPVPDVLDAEFSEAPLVASRAAAGLSGFANYQAFSRSVADPLQSGVWGWTGVIAAIISFGGFTFFYWHTANGRMKEGVRALLFALAGGGTSIVGTQIYIAANNQAAAAEHVQAGSNRDVLETQIADWRRQLEGIPPETRSVEGLEAYLLVQAQTRTSIPGWFFALMLELFSSQGTSIGLVALLILFGRPAVNAGTDNANPQAAKKN